MKVLAISRVAYGKEDTPIGLREYRIVGTPYPVGTLKEWKDFAIRNGFEAVDVVEKLFVISAEEINKKAIEVEL